MRKLGFREDESDFPEAGPLLVTGRLDTPLVPLSCVPGHPESLVAAEAWGLGSPGLTSQLGHLQSSLVSVGDWFWGPLPQPWIPKSKMLTFLI